MNLLVATAPWPILVRIVRTRPGPWTIWGEVPAAVADFLGSEGHTVLDVPLPRPLHRQPLPVEIAATAWQMIVVPALGDPLPIRWPIVRRLAELELPVVVSDGTSWQWVHHDDIPEQDAYTWALDRLSEPPASAASTPDVDLLCVRADYLGDVLLAWPALEAASRTRRVTLATRDRFVPWLAPLAGDAVDVRGFAIDEWVSEPRLPSATDVVDLSPPLTVSPLTPALTHAAAAHRHLRLMDRRACLTIAEMTAEAIGVSLPSWPARAARAGTGLLCPSGSSPERELPPETWASLTRLAADRLGISHWTIVGVARERAEALLAAIPNATTAPFPAHPADVIRLMDAARATLSVSSALAHLSAIRHVPTLVIEHPARPDFVEQVPGDHVHYIRPQSPWWRAQPDAMDVSRAMAAGRDSYGFWVEELASAVEDAAKSLSGVAASR